MQIKLFTIPVTREGNSTEELNKFLRGHNVLEVVQHLVNATNGAYWCFCVKYIHTGLVSTGHADKKQKVDYKSVLDVGTFEVFEKLRKVRKALAGEDAVPAYAVFTDAELSEIAKCKELTAKTVLSIKGIGKQKLEKYGRSLVERHLENES